MWRKYFTRENAKLDYEAKFHLFLLIATNNVSQLLFVSNCCWKYSGISMKKEGNREKHQQEKEDEEKKVTNNLIWFSFLLILFSLFPWWNSIPLYSRSTLIFWFYLVKLSIRITFNFTFINHNLPFSSIYIKKEHFPFSISFLINFNISSRLRWVSLNSRFPKLDHL